MWDDQPLGAVGIPALQQIRGYSTPNLNQMAAEGMLFTRMYTEPSCTPSRAAAMTGQHPVRNGMYAVGFPIEYRGLSKNSVTIAQALSKAGYATAFYGKWHLGDIEESYPFNQGFDEALLGVYNQVSSLYNVQGEAAGAVLGLKEEILAKDLYQLDNKFNQKGYVLYIEGKKGEQGKEWGASQTPQDFMSLDVESEKRAVAFMRKSAAAKKPFYVAWWPMFSPFFASPPPRASLQRGLAGEGYEKTLDPIAGRLMEFLKAQGIAENTLVVAMADNGPMTHNPPPASAKATSPKAEFVSVRRPGGPGSSNPARRSATSSTSPISTRRSRASAARRSISPPTESSTASTRRHCCSRVTHSAVATTSSSTPARRWPPR
jgi:arylsulfatase